MDYVTASLATPTGREFAGDGKPQREITLLTIQLSGEKIRELAESKGTTKPGLIEEILAAKLLDETSRQSISDELSRRLCAKAGLSEKDALVQLATEFPAIERGELTMFAKADGGAIEVCPEYILDPTRTIMNAALGEQNKTQPFRDLEPINYKRLAEKGWFPVQPISFRGIEENDRSGYTLRFGVDHAYFPDGVPQTIHQLMHLPAPSGQHILAKELGTMKDAPPGTAH
jgi:hypothetical protein